MVKYSFNANFEEGREATIRFLPDQILLLRCYLTIVTVTLTVVPLYSLVRGFWEEGLLGENRVLQRDRVLERITMNTLKRVNIRDFIDHMRKL